MKFLLHETDLSGTNAERRISDVIGLGREATMTYKLKDTTFKFCGNNHLYSAQQFAKVKDEMKEMLHFFGYAKVASDPENPTGFYDFTEAQDK